MSKNQTEIVGNVIEVADALKAKYTDLTNAQALEAATKIVAAFANEFKRDK